MIRPFGHSGRVSNPDRRHGTRKPHSSNNCTRSRNIYTPSNSCIHSRSFCITNINNISKFTGNQNNNIISIISNNNSI